MAHSFVNNFYTIIVQIFYQMSTIKREPAAPMIGSLLRMPREYVVARMLAEVNNQGFDVSGTELSVFMYPGPDGRRPIDLARQCNTSRQSMNYILAGLEQRGYIERKSTPDSASSVVHVTTKGQQMYARMRSCVASIEQEWTEYLGVKRFSALRDTLQDLSSWLSETR